MPSEDIQSWSTTAATNAAADTGINWAEGQSRASVNNSARSMMAAHAKERNLQNGSITTGGAANVQTFISGVGYTVVPSGLWVRLKAGFTNTGATTLNMDGIGAVAIKDQSGADLGAGALVTGQYVELIYNGTNWILLTAGASAAPLDALAYNGMQINGAMEVSQERGSSVLAANGYVIDQWGHTSSYAGSFNLSQFGSGPPGFANCLGLLVATAHASLAAGDVIEIGHYIEKCRIDRLAWGSVNAQPITLGFWTGHHRTGTYSVTVRNQPTTTTSYCATYTQNAADVWEYKTITIPGATTGVWGTASNELGMLIHFVLGAGSTFTAPTANIWNVGNLFAAPGQVNGVAATSDIFRITGLVVIPGTAAPDAVRSPLIMRPYPQELETCKRYWRLVQPDIRQAAFAAGAIMAYGYPLAPEMRVAPTITTVATGTNGNVAAISVAPTSGTNLQIKVTAVAAGDCFLDGRTYSANARM